MDKLTEIREALEAATPGPWKDEMEDCGGTSDDLWYRVIKSGDGYMGSNREIKTGFAITGFIAPANAHLISHAPEYITYLLQLVETLQAKNEQLSNEMDSMMIVLEDRSPYAAERYWTYLLSEKDKLVKALEQAKENIRVIDSYGENPWSVTKWCENAIDELDEAIKLTQV